jgi:hypothetical protein
MFLKTVITVVCASGTAFYLRYLVALWKEREPVSHGHWAYLRLGSRENTVLELPERPEPVNRAA